MALVRGEPLTDSQFNQAIDYMIENNVGLHKTLTMLGFGKEPFYRLCREDKKYMDEYLEAKKFQLQFGQEEIEEIVDSIPINTPDGKTDSAHVAWLNNRVKARQWALERLAPKKFGNRVDMTTNGESIVSAHPGKIMVEVVQSGPTKEEIALAEEDAECDKYDEFLRRHGANS